ncbi:MAG: NAD(P)-dependent oxidoreductase, partial [Clostridia bacterium]|nr:NAD(P)-dependent oxidoreductase [Clostridia bacterium]
MKKIIITGATSFIGINLINKLIVNDYQIFAIIRPNSERKSLLPVSEKLNTIEIPMCNYYEMDKYIGESCDVFISLAWNGTRGEARNSEELQVENYNNSIYA